jgi:hypothetical protein
MRPHIPALAAAVLLAASPAIARPATNLSGTYMMQLQEICQPSLSFKSGSSLPTGGNGNVKLISGSATFAPSTLLGTSGQYSALQTTVQGALLVLKLDGTAKGNSFKATAFTNPEGSHSNATDTLTITAQGITQTYTATYGQLDVNDTASLVNVVGVAAGNTACAISGEFRLQAQPAG